MSMFSLPQKTTTNEVATSPRFNLLDDALTSPTQTTATTFGLGAFQSDSSYSVSTTSKPSRQPKRETTVPTEFKASSPAPVQLDVNSATTVPSTIPPAPTVPVGKGLSKVTLVELMKAMGLMGMSLDGENALPSGSAEDSGEEEGSPEGEKESKDSEAQQSDHDHVDKDDVA